MSTLVEGQVGGELGCFFLCFVPLKREKGNRMTCFGWYEASKNVRDTLRLYIIPRCELARLNYIRYIYILMIVREGSFITGHSDNSSPCSTWHNKLLQSGHLIRQMLPTSSLMDWMTAQNKWDVVDRPLYCLLFVFLSYFFYRHWWNSVTSGVGAQCNSSWRRSESPLRRRYGKWETIFS